MVIGCSTVFPVTIMRAATWDPALEEECYGEDPGADLGRWVRA